MATERLGGIRKISFVGFLDLGTDPNLCIVKDVQELYFSSVDRCLSMGYDILSYSEGFPIEYCRASSNSIKLIPESRSIALFDFG